MDAAVIGELYRAHAPRVQSFVRHEVQTSDAVIEDACQHAWSRLLGRRDHVCDEGAFTWLAQTALHEALKLVRREASSLPLEHATGAGLEPATPSVHDLVELRERFDALSTLPRRQQRLLWLHAAGFNYTEMSRREGLSRRTVERQLLRGKRAARALAAAT
jgi:RNA polymerase sigma factor (sigma-70 family)